MTRTFAAPRAGRMVKGLRMPKGMHTRRHMAALGFKAAAPDSTSPSNPLTTRTPTKTPHATPHRLIGPSDPHFLLHPLTLFHHAPSSHHPARSQGKPFGAKAPKATEADTPPSTDTPHGECQ